MKSFVQNWLDIQSQSIEGLCSALFLLFDPESNGLKPEFQWPVGSPEPLELVVIAKLALQRQASVINAGISDEADDGKIFDYLAVPVVSDKRLLGIIAIKTAHHGEQKQQQILHTLTADIKWLAMLQSTEQKPDIFYSKVVKFAINCLQQDSLGKALTALIADFTNEYDCQRIAIGVLKKHHIQVTALSNSAKFDDKSNLISMIASAMDEAMDQDKVIVYPAEGEETQIMLAHAELSRQYGNGAICTIPLVYSGAIFAVLTMERSGTQPFDQETINTCEQTLALVSSFLKLKQDDELFFVEKMAKATKNMLADVFGFKCIGLKLLSLVTLAIIILSLLIEGDYRVHADAVLEGRIQRVIPAPMKGFIDSAKVRAGDTVLKQEIMATMEDAYLKLEKIKLASERQQLKREYRDAMATRDLVQVRILNARLAQTNAKIKLKTEQLQRTAIRAPFDGIVIKGDLSQSLGAPVERGDSLFTVAPLDGYRIILKVDERSISYIQQGQKGLLTLSSQPDRKFPLQVEKITSVASIEGGRNVFRVEATLSKLPKQLRPGMEGIAKVDIGHKKLFWIWTHELVDWVKLWVWSWWP